MSKKIKLYYNMTKMSNKNEITKDDLKRFENKCQNFKEEEKLKLGELMTKGKVKWIQNDFVFVVR